MPTSTYTADETTTDIRDLQQIPTTGLIEADDNAADYAAGAVCTTVSCRYYWTCG